MSFKYLEVSPHDLQANPWNTNQMTAENERKLENSLKRQGFIRPLLVRELASGALQILGGEHRWQIAKNLGYATVPVCNLGAIDELRAKEIGLIDNGRYGEDDTVLLAELLKDMGNVDDLLEVLPMTGAELDNIFAATAIALEDLGLPSSGALPDLNDAATAAPTGQIVRFKVPIADADYVERLVEATMKSQGFTAEDSLTNAGHALVYLLRRA